MHTGLQGLAHLADSGEKVLGPQFINALNGYAVKSHDMLNQVHYSIHFFSRQR